MPAAASVPSFNQTQTYDYGTSPQASSTSYQQPFMDGQTPNFADMLIESQDIDMTGTNGGFAFPSGDMVPWLEYLPQDVLDYFGDLNDNNNMGIDPGSGPPHAKSG